jgi:hypothetical protein
MFALESFTVTPAGMSIVVKLKIFRLCWSPGKLAGLKITVAGVVVTPSEAASSGPSLPSEPLLKLWAPAVRAKPKAINRVRTAILTPGTIGFELDFSVISSSRECVAIQNHLDAMPAPFLTFKSEMAR